VRCDLEELTRKYLQDFDVGKEIEALLKASDTDSNGKEESKMGYRESTGKERGAYSAMNSSSMMHFQGRRPHQFGPSMRGSSSRGGFNRGHMSGSGRMGNLIYDPFRSRPPNTSRPPSLHVDDFVALEGTGGNTMRAGGGPEPYTGRGRGSSRGGGMLNRPFSQDRGRNPRAAPGQGGYYQSQRNDNM
jgi:hypothetical protein